MKRKKSNRPVLPTVVQPEVPVQTSEEKAKAKAARMYFNQNTQAAIVAFQIAHKAGDLKERDKLYVKEILPAFEKLVENLINIYKFTSLHDTYDDLKVDCVTFLYETLNKFDPTRGTNAFSYFNVVCKNYLIIKTKQKSQRSKRAVSLDDPDALSMNEHRIVEDYCTIPSQELLLESESSARAVIEVLYEIRTKARSENELSCINSIITIFENIDEIDILNKSAILLYLRELSNLSPKQLTTTLQSLRKSFKKIKDDPKFKLW